MSRLLTALVLSGSSHGASFHVGNYGQSGGAKGPDFSTINSALAINVSVIGVLGKASQHITEDGGAITAIFRFATPGNFRRIQ